MKRYTLYFYILISSLSFSQEKESAESHHSVAILLGHTYLSQGYVDNKREWLILPSLAIDYNYYFSEKWSIGLHNDIVAENFKVEDKENKTIERTKPISSLLVGGFKPGKHFTYQLGLGGEFAKEENLFVTRIGAEYSLEINNGWEFLTNLVYDIKWNTYDSIGLSVGVAKKIGK